MDLSFLASLADYGAGILGIVILAILLFTIIKNQQKNQEWFIKYVNENNHQKEEMICKHTEALVEVKNSIRENTKIIKNLIGEIRRN